MKDVNKIILLGRLGADPVGRKTKSGVSVVQFSLATSRLTASSEGDSPIQTTQWHRVVAWGKLGENCLQFLKKGEVAYVEGEVRSNKYEGKDGKERLSFEVHANQVKFLGGASKEKLVS